MYIDYVPIYNFIKIADTCIHFLLSNQILKYLHKKSLHKNLKILITY